MSQLVNGTLTGSFEKGDLVYYWCAADDMPEGYLVMFNTEGEVTGPAPAGYTDTCVNVHFIGNPDPVTCPVRKLQRFAPLYRQ